MQAIEEIQEQIDNITRIGTEANTKAIDAMKAGKYDEYESCRADVEKYSKLARGLRQQMEDAKALQNEKKASDRVPTGEPKTGEPEKPDHMKKGDPEDDDPEVQEYYRYLSKAHRPWTEGVVRSDGFKNVKERHEKGMSFRPKEDTYSAKVGAFGHYISDKNPSMQEFRNMEQRALYTTGGDEGQGGVFIQPVQSPRILDRVLDKPLRILDVLRVEQTTADIIEYYVLNSETNNADIVREWDLDEVPPNFGISPESDMNFDKEEMSMKEIRTHVRASDKALRDLARLRSMIEGRLRYFVRSKLETEVLTGDGTGDHFLGLMNWPGIATREHKVSARSAVDNTPADTIALAITDLTLAGFEPNLILAHPYLLELLRLLKDADKNYLNIYDNVRRAVWQVPFAVSERMPQYTAVAGDFDIGATLYDRMNTEISVGQPGDLFLRRAWAVMAVLMAGFVVEYPTAFERIISLNT